MAEVLWQPRTALLAGRVNLKLESHWIGVEHTAREYSVRGDRYATPPDFAQRLVAKDGKELYRSRVLLHSFLWDEQAVSGARWEVILERGRTDEPKFEELLAVMGDPAKPEQGQLLVMRGEDDAWFEPDPTADQRSEVARKYDFFLETLGCLSLNGANPDEILALQSKK